MNPTYPPECRACHELHKAYKRIEDLQQKLDEVGRIEELKWEFRTKNDNLQDALDEAYERIEELEHELRAEKDNPGYTIEEGVIHDD